MLLVKNLCKSFQDASGRRLVLDRVCLSAGAGQFLAITGPSGSGKSTLLNTIAAIETTDSGRIEVSGVDVTALKEPQSTLYRRSRVGFVYQSFNLIPTLTVEENLRLPLELCGISDSSRVIDMLAQLGLADRASSYPGVLSGGEQQRVAIGRAMIHRPVLILADEPTGNLDEKAGDKVLQLLRQAATQGACVLMVTHSQRAAAMADREFRLSGGRLSETTRHVAVGDPV